MNLVNVTITILGITYLTFLMAIYFSKKNMPNIENKIYKVLLVLSLLITASDLGFWTTCYYLKDTPYIVEVIQKIYLTFLIFWLVYLDYYIIVVTNPNSKLVKKYLGVNGRISIYPGLVALVLSVIQFYLPLSFEVGDNGVLLYAIGDIYLYIVGVVLLAIFVGVAAAIFGRENISIKKSTPMIIFGIYEFVIFAIYTQNRTICAFSLSSTLTSYLMYHTIENPDIKLINQLELAKRQAELSNKAKTDFLASMSHEILTPLNAIMGLSQIIKNNDNVEQIHEDTDDVILASETLLELVNGILDINKIEANKMELIQVNYKPRDVFDDLERMIRIRIGERPIKLNTHISPDLPLELYGDSEKVKAITSNFLTNSVKYTEQGSIDLIVDCVNEKNKCNLTITVKDTGRGIKDEQKEQLFTKFNRREEDKDSDISGTGLGLAITRSLVELLDGKISFDSVYGEGSTFTVTLTQKIITLAPEAREEVKEDNLSADVNTTSSQHTIAPQSDGKLKLIIVDDNKLNLKVASKLLSSFNFDVETANSGYECIDRINSGEQFNLIFMDIMMPNMDGVETMHKLKENGYPKPIVALTADCMEGSREKYLSEGFDDYLSKPIDQMTMSETLEKFLKLNVINQDEANKRQSAYDQQNVVENTNLDDIEVI